jgi:hypothetical protein
VSFDVVHRRLRYPERPEPLRLREVRRLAPQRLVLR